MEQASGQAAQSWTALAARHAYKHVRVWVAMHQQKVTSCLHTGAFLVPVVSIRLGYSMLVSLIHAGSKNASLHRMSVGA